MIQPLKKNQKLLNFIPVNTLFMIIKVIISVFLLWFCIGLFLFTELSTFLFLFLSFPLILAIGIYNLFSLSFFYSFVIGFLIQWFVFLNVNPYPLENNNKLEIMSYIPETYKPEQEHLMSSLNIEQMEQIEYPIILKPIICSGNGKDIFIINNYEEFVNLMIAGKHQIEPSNYMIEQYLEDHDVEISVFYERKPWEEKGKVIEIVEKTQKDKIRPHVFSFTVNHPELITEKVQEMFEIISRKIPDFYVGRYDIRLKNIEDLEKGDFKILEVNGTMGMRLTSDSHLLNSNDLYIDSNWYLSRLQIGAYNMATLKGYSPLQLLQVLWISLNNGIGCNDWENIFSLYS